MHNTIKVLLIIGVIIASLVFAEVSEEGILVLLLGFILGVAYMMASRKKELEIGMKTLEKRKEKANEREAQEFIATNSAKN